jgi:hypothetical protein
MPNIQVLLVVFIVVTSVAIVIQLGILVALYTTVRRSTAHMEALATEIHSRAMPTLDAAQNMIAEYRPKLNTVLDNVVSASFTLKQQVTSLEEPVADVLERTRAQVARVDELVTRTLDRVEETSELVDQNIISPLRRASGLFQGVSMGLSTLFHRNSGAHGRKPVGVPVDDMFI